MLGWVCFSLSELPKDFQRIFFFFFWKSFKHHIIIFRKSECFCVFNMYKTRCINVVEANPPWFSMIFASCFQVFEARSSNTSHKARLLTRKEKHNKEWNNVQLLCVFYFFPSFLPSEKCFKMRRHNINNSLNKPFLPIGRGDDEQLCEKISFKIFLCHKHAKL